MAVSTTSALAFGLAPALITARVDPGDLLRTVAPGAAGAVSGARARRALVTAEIAVSLLLLAGAGLLMRSLTRLMDFDLGFRPAQVISARVWLPQPNIPSTGPYFQHTARVLLYRKLLERLSAVPGVSSVGIVSPLPLTGRSNGAFTIEGADLAQAEVQLSEVAFASPGYFRTMGIELLRGRVLDDRDAESAPRVVVISESLAKRAFAGQDPIGKRIRPGNRGSTAPWHEVVGIVRDVASEGPGGERRPQYYRSALQASGLSFAIVARAERNPAGLAQAIRSEVLAIDPDLPVFEVRTLDEMIGGVLASRRYTMWLIGVFAFAAVFLALIGVYAILAFDVAQRRYEIGVRLALGADRGTIARLVLGRATRLIGAGVVVGLAATALTTRLIGGLLYGVSPTDPITYVGVVLLLAVAGLVAAMAPARRAMRTDPVLALKAE